MAMRGLSTGKRITMNESQPNIPDDPQRQSLRHNSAADEQILNYVIDAARLLSDLHCEDIVIFDVREQCELTDYILIATGTSDRQIKSVGSDLEVAAKAAGLTKFGREVDEMTNWLVIDLIDVVAHLFEPAARAHYDLEMMWGDAPKVKWRR